MADLRSRVLPLGQKLARRPEPELERLERPDTHYTIGWSRGREEFKPGVPDVGKGSFYYNPFSDGNVFPTGDALPELEDSLEEMTHFMASVGLWIVRLIDSYLGGDRDLNIHGSLKSCEMAKARLLYYYPAEASCDAAAGVDPNCSDGGNENWWCG